MFGMKPKWTHDCKACKYVGSDTDHDWYVCRDSVVARFGDDGPEYWSMPKMMVNNDDYLTATAQDNRTVFYTMPILARFMLQRLAQEQLKAESMR